jgi:hypothetical protein
MGEIEKLAGIGGQKKPVRTKFEEFINALAQVINQSYIDTIKDKSSKSSGATGQSVIAVPKGTTIEISADYQFKFIDEGVNGLPSVPGYNYTRSVVTNSPYSFRTPTVSEAMAKAMAGYVGTDITAGYAIGYSVKRHGIAPKGITDSVWSEENIQEIERALLDLTGLSVNLIFQR